MCLFLNDHFILKHHVFLFFFHFQKFKVLWVHQVKIYINDLSYRGKRPTLKSHKKYECVYVKM
jgi:hypothetical protein